MSSDPTALRKIASLRMLGPLNAESQGHGLFWNKRLPNTLALRIFQGCTSVASHPHFLREAGRSVIKTFLCSIFEAFLSRLSENLSFWQALLRYL